MVYEIVINPHDFAASKTVEMPYVTMKKQEKNDTRETLTYGDSSIKNDESWNISTGDITPKLVQAAWGVFDLSLVYTTFYTSIILLKGCPGEVK